MGKRNSVDSGGGSGERKRSNKRDGRKFHDTIPLLADDKSWMDKDTLD